MQRSMHNSIWQCPHAVCECLHVPMHRDVDVRTCSDFFKCLMASLTSPACVCLARWHIGPFFCHSDSPAWHTSQFGREHSCTYPFSLLLPKSFLTADLDRYTSRVPYVEYSRPYSAGSVRVLASCFRTPSVIFASNSGLNPSALNASSSALPLSLFKLLVSSSRPSPE